MSNDDGIGVGDMKRKSKPWPTPTIPKPPQLPEDKKDTHETR